MARQPFNNKYVSDFNDREDVQLILADELETDNNGSGNCVNSSTASGTQIRHTFENNQLRHNDTENLSFNRQSSCETRPLPYNTNCGAHAVYQGESVVNATEQPLSQQRFDEIHGIRHVVSNPGRNQCSIFTSCSSNRVGRRIIGFLPCIMMLSSYDFRKNFVCDILAGLTVCVMHIPQGMAYGMLAHLPPVYGLYSSIFPVLFYFVFGTSRHISVGTFAVVTLMVSAPVTRLTQSLPVYRLNATTKSPFPATLQLPTASSLGSADASLSVGGGRESDVPSDDQLVYFGDMVLTRAQCHVQVAIAVTLLTGLIQVGMAALRLGFLTIYLSQAMVNGFTTGAAFHVMTSQIVYVLGYKPSQHFTGPFKLIHIYLDLLENCEKFNSVAFAIAVVCVSILVLVKEFLQPRLSKVIRVPIPIDLVLIVTGTVISYELDLAAYGVFTIGKIPAGLPSPQVPDVRLFGAVVTDSALIAIVSYAITISMARIFALKHGYEVSSNQELLALGLSNTFSSFLNCHANSASLSRSIVQEGAGCRSQVTSLVSCAGLTLVILFVAPLFETVPNCVLASIILVALKGLFMQLGDLPKQWRTSKYDFAIWIVTFLATVVINVDYGLVAGLLFSIGTLLYRTQSASASVLGQIRDTGVFEDLSAYRDAYELPGIKVFRYDGPLHFASAEHFREVLFAKTRLPPRNYEAERELQLDGDENSRCCRYLVIDCGAVNFIDATGVGALAAVFDSCCSHSVTLLLAGAKREVRDALERLDFFKRRSRDCLFVTVNDAVAVALHGLPIQSDGARRDSSLVNSELQATATPRDINLQPLRRQKDGDSEVVAHQSLPSSLQNGFPRADLPHSQLNGGLL